ncbi:hypothetical protein BX592_120112 [Paraburkholderia rhizosphaerae]|uniref:LysR substrate binding domain-containing protein n=1 Tax=Paraburkholderia rhizosphaerae TaxID=480658 RepID=A0A4R8LJU7_9BURK|nr:hypothetical protein BX592_120112 [Paraburkholderia rhizosphaerae]
MRHAPGIATNRAVIPNAALVEAGLALAPLALCSVPKHLVQLGEAEGLPPLAELEVVLARSARSARPPCDFLAQQILADWTTTNRMPHQVA